MSRSTSFLAILLLGLLTTSPEAARSAVASDADIVRLVVDCDGADDCFETTADVVAWIVGTRTPTAAEPLLVDIGPGTFGQLNCQLTPFSHVTFRGAGRESTRIADPLVGFVAQNCFALEFIDLAIEGSVHSVAWLAGGSSQWTDTDLIGRWYDFACGDPGDPRDVGVHYFYGTRVISAAQFAFFSQCGENWLYGSEIIARPTVPEGRLNALEIGARGAVLLYGSAVRVSTELLPPTANVEWVGGVAVGGSWNSVTPGNGRFHMHGGIISVDATNLDEADVVGIEVDRHASGTGTAHTPDTAFALRGAATGDVARIVGPAASPFLWPAGTTPPVSGSETNELTSEHGKDLFVETDCKADGTCDDGQSPGAEAHLMVYDLSCSVSDPWRDAMTGRCRNVTP